MPTAPSYPTVCAADGGIVPTYTAHGGAANIPGPFGDNSGWSFNGGYVYTDQVVGSVYSIEFWVQNREIFSEQTLLANGFVSSLGDLFMYGLMIGDKTTFQQLITTPSGGFAATGASWQPSLGGFDNAADWNHIVCTCDGLTARAYCNGQMVSSSTLAPGSTIRTSTRALVLGGRPHATPGTATNLGASASISDVRVYAQALPIDRVIAHYAARGTTTYPDASTFTGAYASTVLADNPGCYYRCDEDAGGTAAVDRSPHAVPAAYLAGETVLGIPGALVDGDPAAHFEGAYTRVAGVVAGVIGPGIGEAFSIELWVDVAAPPGTNQHSVLAATCGQNELLGFHLTLDASLKVQFGLLNGVLGASGIPGPTLAPSAWHYVVVTFDGTHQALYIEGALYDSSARLSAAPSTFARGLTVGCYAGPSNETGELYGVVDEVAFYTYALTAAQVAAHYAAAFATPTPPAPGVIVNDDRHYFDLRVYDAHGALLEVPHEDIEAWNVTDVLNGGSATGQITFRRPFNAIGALAYLNRVQLWFWHGRIARPLNPYWAGYMLEPDQEKLATTGKITMHLEGDQKLLGRGLVIENINPGVTGNPQMDAADYLRHLYSTYADPSLGTTSIPSAMFPLQPLQFQRQKLDAVVDTVIKSGRTSLGQMWTWFVRSDYNLRRTFTAQADANPNLNPSLKFAHLIVADDCSAYTIQTRYRDIINVILVEGGKDESTGQNAYAVYEDSNSISAYGAWEDSISVPAIRSQDAALAFGQAYLDMYANPQAQGSAELHVPRPDIFAGTWVQFWELASVVKQVRVGQVRVETEPKGRIKQTLSTDAPTPYLDEAVYKVGFNAQNSALGSVKQLPVNTQNAFVRLGAATTVP